MAESSNRKVGGAVKLIVSLVAVFVAIIVALLWYYLNFSMGSIILLMFSKKKLFFMLFTKDL